MLHSFVLWIGDRDDDQSGNLHILLPPSLHHQGDVEAKQERKRHLLTVLEPDDNLRFFIEIEIPCFLDEPVQTWPALEIP